MTYFETHFVLCANCWPTTPTFDPPSNSISSIVKCGKNSIGINAFLEKAYGCSLCRGFGRKMYREKYGLFVDDDDSLFWKEAYYCNFFPSRPLKILWQISFYWLHYFAIMSVSKIMMDHFKFFFCFTQPCTKISETSYLFLEEKVYKG